MNATDKEKKSLYQIDGARTWVMQGGEHDTQSGKVLKGSDELNTSIKSNEQSKQK